MEALAAEFLEEPPIDYDSDAAANEIPVPQQQSLASSVSARPRRYLNMPLRIARIQRKH